MIMTDEDGIPGSALVSGTITVRGREVQLPGRKNKSPLGWYISQGAVWQIPLHRHLVHDYV